MRRAALFFDGLLSRCRLLDWLLADPVDCTVFSPPSVARSDWLSVLVFVHRPDQHRETTALAHEIDQQAVQRAFKSLEVGIRPGSVVMFHIHVPGFEFPTTTERLVWPSRPVYVHFLGKARSETPVGTAIGNVTVSRDGVPVGSITFRVEIVAENQRPIAANALFPDTAAKRRRSLLPSGERVRRYKKAFISYASKDRPEVLKRVQMLRLVHIRYFHDLLKLRARRRWERELFRHIDRSDLFLLFWSTNAKESKWVLEEARYAIKRKAGNDFAPPDIVPVVIEGPPVPKPPDDLAHLHFNDYLLYFMIPEELPSVRAQPGTVPPSGA